MAASFDNVRHDRLLAKVAQRVDDADVMHLLKVMLKAGGKQGVPQGGVISPLLSNIYLTEVDRMLERAREATRYGKYTLTVAMPARPDPSRAPARTLFRRTRIQVAPSASKPVAPMAAFWVLRTYRLVWECQQRIE